MRFCNRFIDLFRKNWKNILISIVILAEVIAISFVAVRAWVETVSSIKIINETGTNSKIDTYVFTEAMIGGESGTIDLGKYFKPAGDMHFSPASSADGRTMFFPARISSGIAYRKGNVSDKNTSYMSVTFKLRADTNADFFFDQVPTFSQLGGDIRVSVSSRSEGSSAAPETVIYANTASNASVVNATDGTMTTTSVKAFSAHIKGTRSANRLFAVGANETKIVTINVWLQKKASDNTDLTENMSKSIAVTNFGITSSLTPRHVTLLPTPTWDISNKPQYFYAWCWGATNGDDDRLYKLELDENEHYSFDYNGTYQNTLFIRCGNASLNTSDMIGSWSNLGLWNKTMDTSIPDEPIDPTYIIETINGGSHDDDINANKSTGSWVTPTAVNLAYVTNQDTWGTVSATSYIGTTTSTHVLEATNSSSSKHKTTIHAWPGKKVTLTATPTNSDYAFIGWYNNPEGLDNGADKRQLSTAASYTFDASTTATEFTYYAKFKEVRTLTIIKYLDGNPSSAAVGTITIGGNTSANNVDSYSKTFDKGTEVTFSATALDGYALSGIFSLATGGSTITSPIPLNNDTTYYAQFTTNSYDVTANAYYSTNGGSTYTAGDTGGTVKAGYAEAGASSISSVKYKSSVSLVATASSGYEFVGWYNAASGGTKLSDDSTYPYTLSTTGEKNVYARFIREEWILKYGASGGSNWSSENMTVSGDNVTGTMTLTEGQEFSFQLNKRIGNAETWYGANNASYSNITSTSFITNLSLSANGGSGNDIYMKGHAGTYTFTFNKSSNVLNVTVSYSKITITFYDNTNDHWIHNDSAKMFYGSDEGWMSSDTPMNVDTDNSTYWTYTYSVPSNYCTNPKFQRRVNGNTKNTWSPSNRGYLTRYKATGDGTGQWL